ncbi:DUF488 domain-containing protein [Nitrosopumilus oxyclinae]|uniref:DUF488 domain-containing protein n=1 Tax=Nitrosopumilus oxyclinae TaxID=1959104 RepID=A0A7D5RB91_9ARCH|nr:DUF488 family protein [Nitrosopumilus oxyclinae]QLH05121.1 DUF488 domain-containing protein [Nitrosopumilus oxyclinae]
MIKIKRVYDNYSETDGHRILVDRLWPRGISKENAKIDLWIKEITPSTDLRKWYHDNLDKQEEFQKKYIVEIDKNFDSLNNIKKILNNQKTITLLTASKDSKPIHAIVLQQKLER